MTAVILTVLQIYCAQIGNSDGYLRYGIFAYQTPGSNEIKTAKFQEQALGTLEAHPLCDAVKTGLSQGTPTFQCLFQDDEIQSCRPF